MKIKKKKPKKNINLYLNGGFYSNFIDLIDMDINNIFYFDLIKNSFHFLNGI